MAAASDVGLSFRRKSESEDSRRGFIVHCTSFESNKDLALGNHTEAGNSDGSAAWPQIVVGPSQSNAVYRITGMLTPSAGVLMDRLRVLFGSCSIC
jgi:hypothetical protein